MSPRRKFSWEPGLGFWGEGSAHALVGRWTEPELRCELPREGVTSWEGPALTTFSSGPGCFVCMSLPVSLIKLFASAYQWVISDCWVSSAQSSAEVWTHGKDPSPNPNIFQDISLPVYLWVWASKLQIFCLSLWLLRRQIVCGFIASKYTAHPGWDLVTSGNRGLHFLLYCGSCYLESECGSYTSSEACGDMVQHAVFHC